MSKFSYLTPLPIVLWILTFQLSSLIPYDDRPQIYTSVLPDIEEFLFGTPFIYKLMPHNAYLSVLASAPYLMHFFLPFICGVLIWKMEPGCKRCKRWAMLSFLWAFGCLNMLALVTQIAFPTAPPWWYDTREPLHNANQAHLPHTVTYYPSATYNTSSSEARLHEADLALHSHMFHAIYGQAPVVFGSFPSLHAAWPLLIGLFMWKNSPRVVKCLIPLYWAWIWLAAVYLEHHFIVDILGAILFVSAIELTRRTALAPEKCNCSVNLHRKLQSVWDLVDDTSEDINSDDEEEDEDEDMDVEVVDSSMKGRTGKRYQLKHL